MCGTAPYNMSTYKFVAPTAGLYFFSVQWSCSTTAAHNNHLLKNGVSESVSYNANLTHVVYMNTTDYMEVMAWHDDSVDRLLLLDWQIPHVTCKVL